MEESITTSEIMSDLVRIHEERIDTYTRILRQSGRIKSGVKSIFEGIIDEGSQCLRQLRDHMQYGMSSPGKIYQLWTNEKQPVTYAAADNMLASCASDELIANNTYSIAASLETNDDIRTLLEEHQHRIKQLYKRILNYLDAQ